MGQSAFVKKKSSSGWIIKTQSLRLGIDVPLLLTVITLIVYGILMVYSASWDFSLFVYDSPTFIFTRQLTWLGIGLLIAVFLAWMDYHYWRKIAVGALVLTIFSLVAVLAINEVRYGAARTIRGGSFQPSELAKLVTLIYLSVWLYAKRDQLGSVSFGLIPLAGILGVVGGLIVLQPDLSALATVVFLGFLLFFLAGADIRQLLLLLIFSVSMGILVVNVSPTGSKRVSEYILALQNPTEGAYHLKRSLGAFVDGGWLGTGIGKATHKYTGLPVPPTDSIFAIIGEETGVLGASLLVILFALLMWRGLVISHNAPDQMGSLLAAGLSGWITLEAFMNMAVMLGLLPFSGNALPFISAGGSNLIVSMAAIGILMNISRKSYEKEDQIGRSLSAVVDLRRRNGRGRVSRSRRSVRNSK